MTKSQIQVRRAGVEDAAEIARLLRDFNLEYSEPTPEVEELAKTIARLLEEDEITVFLAGEEPDGLSLFRFRPGIWSSGAEAYLQELYVVPELRGRGIGRALLRATIELARERGADGIDLNTAETDTAARTLYESMGFSNLEGSPEGPRMFFYEREI
jgi:ribosomal protein S18 acetylase RimI-like enzyme